MLRAIPLAFADIVDPAIMAILLKSVLITLLIFAGLGVVAGYALTGIDPCGWWSMDSCMLGWSSGGLGAVVLTALAIWFLFPAIALGVIAAYSDQVIAAVEARHYPAARAAARPVGWIGGAWLGLRSAVRLLLYNVIALPFYLLLLVTGIGPIILFVIVNGIAIGRDFGEMVAARHGDRTSRGAWLAATRGDRALIGMIATGLFLIPFVNLIAPIVGAAMAAHLYHQRTPQA